jgi:hypothetical protein
MKSNFGDGEVSLKNIDNEEMQPKSSMGKRPSSVKNIHSNQANQAVTTSTSINNEINPK